MASNAPIRKPSNATNSRISPKSFKSEMATRTYHQPVVVSPSGKVISKEKEMKLKPQILKINTKQSTKRVEIVEPVRPVIANVSNIERQMVTEKQNMEQQTRPSRKMKLEDCVQRTKDLRSAVIETLSVNKQSKESKSPEKLEKPEAAHQKARTKNQSHNTKVFFDKYLKFAYDLSTPTGVRQLEEHFFPNQSNATTHSKPNELGNFPEKHYRTPEDKMTTARQNTKPIETKLQQFKDAQ